MADSLPGWFEALDDFAEKLAAIKVSCVGRNRECVDASHVQSSHAAAHAFKKLMVHVSAMV